MPLRQIVLMFLPIIGYSLGDYLVGHWAFAKRLDPLLKPYAFNASLLFGLVIGLFQLTREYLKKREWSSYTLQQLGMLLLFTVVPLYFGHFIHGWSTFGFVWAVVALVYGLDAGFGAPLFLAYPKHFAPEVSERLNEPLVRRILIQLEVGFVVASLLNGAFVLLGNRLLPKAVYLLLLPFYGKALWGAFMAFAFGYPRWVRRRRDVQVAIAS